MNINDKQSKQKYWVSLFIEKSTLYFDCFEIEYIPHKVLSKIKEKSITRNTCRIQSDDSIMSGFYFIAFIEYILAEKIYFIPN